MLDIYNILNLNREKYPISGILDNESIYKVEQLNDNTISEKSSILFTIKKNTYEYAYKKELDITKIEFIKNKDENLTLNLVFFIEKTVFSKKNNDVDNCVSFYNFMLDNNSHLILINHFFNDYKPLYPIYNNRSNELRFKVDPLVFVLENITNYTPEINDIFNIKFDSDIQDTPVLKNMIYNFNKIFDLIVDKNLVSNNKIRIGN